MENAWDFGPGNFQDPGAWNASAYPVASGVDFGGGWSQTFQDIARTATSAYTQNMLMQTNQQGQRYLEGQRLAAIQSGLGGVRPGTLLLIGGAVLLYVMLKD